MGKNNDIFIQNTHNSAELCCLSAPHIIVLFTKMYCTGIGCRYPLADPSNSLK